MTSALTTRLVNQLVTMMLVRLVMTIFPPFAPYRMPKVLPCANEGRLQTTGDWA